MQGDKRTALARKVEFTDEHLDAVEGGVGQLGFGDGMRGRQPIVAGGAGTGKANVQDITFVKYVD